MGSHQKSEEIQTNTFHWKKVCCCCCDALLENKIQQMYDNKKIKNLNLKQNDITELNIPNIPEPLAVGFSMEPSEFSAFMGFGAHLIL